MMRVFSSDLLRYENMLMIFCILNLLHKVSASNMSGLHRAASYQPVEHYALLGRSFMNISGISVARCSARCIRNQLCFSFNYDHINRVCQMNNATREQVDDFKAKPNDFLLRRNCRIHQLRGKHTIFFSNTNLTYVLVCTLHITVFCLLPKRR